MLYKSEIKSEGWVCHGAGRVHIHLFLLHLCGPDRVRHHQLYHHLLQEAPALGGEQPGERSVIKNHRNYFRCLYRNYP